MKPDENDRFHGMARLPAETTNRNDLNAVGIIGMHNQVPRGNGFHAFRHANATLMSSFGASQKLRQQRLGHADGSPITETIYTHVISEDGRRVAAQLGNAVWGVLDAIGVRRDKPA
jgi:integrase